MELIDIFDRYKHANSLADNNQEAVNQGFSLLEFHVGLIALVLPFDLLVSKTSHLMCVSWVPIASFDFPVEIQHRQLLTMSWYDVR